MSVNIYILMIQLKLRDNLRYYDDFDTDFSIKAGEVKEFPERLLKSYSFKRALMNGDLILVQGSVEFKFKDALFKVSSENPNDGIFLFADNSMQVKDLKTQTMKSVEQVDKKSDTIDVKTKVSDTIDVKTKSDTIDVKTKVSDTIDIKTKVSGSLSTENPNEETMKNGKTAGK